MSKVPRLLVVDDDPNLCRAIAHGLGGLGYQVEALTDPLAALARLQAEAFDIAVLDYNMPGLDGVELFKQARQTRPELMGVFVTAFTQLNTVYPAVAAGAHRVIGKPVDFAELRQVIEECATQMAGGTDRSCLDGA